MKTPILISTENSLILVDKGNHQPTICFFQAKLHCVVAALQIVLCFPDLLTIKIQILFIGHDGSPSNVALYLLTERTYLALIWGNKCKHVPKNTR